MKRNSFFSVLLAIILLAGNTLYSQSNRITPSTFEPDGSLLQYNSSAVVKSTTDQSKVFAPKSIDLNNFQSNVKVLKGVNQTLLLDDPRAVNNYAVSGPSANVYSVISGINPSTWRNGNDSDENLAIVPLGFSYIYNGVKFDSLLIGTNGLATFYNNTSSDGATGPYNFNNANFSAVGGAVMTLAPMWDDLSMDVNGLSDISYSTSGGVFTVQWKNANVWLASPSYNMNFQIKIYQSDNHIEFVYGTMTPGTGALSYSCGINGSSLTATPTAAELLTQQTANGSSFSNTVQNALATIVTGSTKISFTPPVQSAPTAPSGVNVTGVTSTTATINWTDNSSTETGFPIYISLDNVVFTYVFTSPANSTSGTIVNFQANTNYFVRVYSSVETQISAAASGSFTTNNLNPLSGTYTINPSIGISLTNFQSFFQADTALTINGVSGPVTFNVSGGTFVENVLLTPITGTSKTNNVKFVGSNVTRTIIAPSAGGADNAIISLRSVSYVTYDNIDLYDAANIGTGVFMFYQFSTDPGCNHVTIKNGSITMDADGVQNALAGAVFMAYSSGLISGHNNNKFQNLNINGGDRGIQDNNGTTAFFQDSIEISGCTFGQTKYIGDSLATGGQAIGVFLSVVRDVNISNNVFASVKGAHPSGPNACASMVIQGGAGNIYNNKFLETYFANTSNTTGAVRAIGVSGLPTPSGLLNVYNNFISNVRRGYIGAANATVATFGIRATQSFTGGLPVNYYYNSILLSTPIAVNYTSACLGEFVGTGYTFVLRDNIFSNTTSTTDPTARALALWEGNAINAMTSDFNNLSATGTNGFVAQKQTTAYSTVAAWTAATGLDANSSGSVVTFANPLTGDLHLAGASIGDISLLGDPIAGYTVDIDGNPRGAKPYKGADEALGLTKLTLKFNFEACPDPSAITVELRNSVSPYGFIESANGVGGGNANAVFNYGNAAGGSYYVVVKSLNGIETWSSAPVTFTNHIATYDFTTNINKAYGNNQRLDLITNSIPSFYQGDVDQDGLIDLTDLSITFNVVSSFGYTAATDLNCDGVVDLTDLTIVFNNASVFIEAKRP